MNKSDEFKMLQLVYKNDWVAFMDLVSTVEDFCVKSKLQSVRVNANKLYSLKGKKSISRKDIFMVIENGKQIQEKLKSRYSLYDDLFNQILARNVITRYVRNYKKKKAEQNKADFLKIVAVKK